MKKQIMLIVLLLLAGRIQLRAQSYELQRLILDIEKLNQLKVLLTDVQKGYQILSQGYGTIKDLSEGNFSLHKLFLDGLLAVSPAVRNDAQAIDIIRYETEIVAGCHAATKQFRTRGHFNPDDMGYLTRVYEHLLAESATNLGHLVNILTDGKLRMNDAARLAAIDGIYTRTKTHWLFMRQFSDGSAVLSGQRQTESRDIQSTKEMLGLE